MAFFDWDGDGDRDSDDDLIEFMIHQEHRLKNKYDDFYDLPSSSGNSGENSAGGCLATMILVLLVIYIIGNLFS